MKIKIKYVIEKGKICNPETSHPDNNIIANNFNTRIILLRINNNSHVLVIEPQLQVLG